MTKSLKVILATLGSFAVYFILDELYFRTFRTFINQYIHQIGISHILAYSVSAIPLVLGALFIHKKKELISAFGLHKSALSAFLFSLACTIPMLAGYAIVFSFNHEISLNSLLISVLAAGFFEEVFFRGFLYGQLFRYTKLGFLPSVLLGSLLFAAMHLYQSEDMLTLTGIFLVTLLGSLLFAWAFTEWEFNIWVPVFFTPADEFIF